MAAENLVSTGQMSQILEVSHTHVLNLIAGGQLPAIKTAVGYIAKLEDVQKLAEERRAKARRGRVAA